MASDFDNFYYPASSNVPDRGLAHEQSPMPPRQTQSVDYPTLSHRADSDDPRATAYGTGPESDREYTEPDNNAAAFPPITDAPATAVPRPDQAQPEPLVDLGQDHRAVDTSTGDPVAPSRDDMHTRAKELEETNLEPRPDDPVDPRDLQMHRAVRGIAYRAISAIFDNRKDLSNLSPDEVEAAVREEVATFEDRLPLAVRGIWQKALNEVVGPPVAIDAGQEEPVPGEVGDDPVRRLPLREQPVRTGGWRTEPVSEQREQQTPRHVEAAELATTVKVDSVIVHTWADYHMRVHYNGQRDASPKTLAGMQAFGEGSFGDMSALRQRPLGSAKLYEPGTLQPSEAVEALAFAVVTENITRTVPVVEPGRLFRAERRSEREEIIGTRPVTIQNPLTAKEERLYYLDYVFDPHRIERTHFDRYREYTSVYGPPGDIRGGNAIRVHTAVPKSTVQSVVLAWAAGDDEYVRSVFEEVVLNNGGIALDDWIGRSRPPVRPPYEGVPPDHQMYLGVVPKNSSDSRMLAYTRPPSMDELRRILRQ